MIDAGPFPVAYCGTPPVPSELWTRWNFDPVLIAVLLGALAAYWVAARGRDDLGALHKTAFLGGWGVTAAAFLTPLCALSVALFSARVGQHMILILIAAPLLAFGRPDRAFGWERAGGGITAGTVLLAAALWFWHLPAPYDVTLRNDAAYWLMHVTLLGAGYLFWRAKLTAMVENCAGAVTAGLATAMQMSLLGAVLTFSASVLYASHLATAAQWGLTPLEDQQLGGLIMWVPGGLVLIASSLAAIGFAMRDQSAAAPAP